MSTIDIRRLAVQNAEKENRHRRSPPMYLRSLVQAWLKNAANAKVREAVVQAAKGQLAQPAVEPPTGELKACHLGIVFALGIESGCLEDILQGALTIRGSGLVVREGGLKGRRVVVMLSGAGRKKAAAATELLIDGHRPQRVISAGFAGGLCPSLKRHDILIADRLLDANGGEMPVELPAGLAAMVAQPGVRCGPLLTADHVVRLPSEKQSLFERYGALAVDMETFAVAEVCGRRQIAFSSIRVINDPADEELPRDMEHLLAQKTEAARLGAAVGAFWRRPASAKDMYQLRENALVASDRLAKFLAQTGFD
jgi:adenosylhomocysteine nucleosidase